MIAVRPDKIIFPSFLLHTVECEPQPQRKTNLPTPNQKKLHGDRDGARIDIKYEVSSKNGRKITWKVSSWIWLKKKKHTD